MLVSQSSGPNKYRKFFKKRVSYSVAEDEQGSELQTAGHWNQLYQHLDQSV